MQAFIYVTTNPRVLDKRQFWCTVLFPTRQPCGYSQACASGCALASAEASAMAKATSTAFQQVFGCDSQIGTYLKSSTYQQAWAKVDLAGYTYACSSGESATVLNMQLFVWILASTNAIQSHKYPQVGSSLPRHCCASWQHR